MVSVLGKNIRAIREEKDMTAADLSRSSGVAPSIISEIENGVRSGITAKNVEKIAKALNVSVGTLFETNNGDEIEVQDIAEALYIIMSADKLTLDDVELSSKEKMYLKKGIEAAFEFIRNSREG